MWSPSIANDGHWVGTVDGFWYKRGIMQIVLLVEMVYYDEAVYQKRHKYSNHLAFLRLG